MSSHIRTALVMSRLARLTHPDAPWLLGLRAGLRYIHERGDRLLIGDGTAGCDFVRRGAELLGMNWTISPGPEVTSSTSTAGVTERDAFPVRDRTLAESADELLVLSLRDNGHWHRLLRERLNSGRGGVTLIHLNGLQSEAVRIELLALGASVWHPDSTQLRPLRAAAKGVHAGAVIQNDCSAVVELVPFPSADGWAYLSHTTRACAGPWPQQSPDDYLDSLLQSRCDADHSPLEALARIVMERRLIASARTARGGRRVVSLTTAPLSQLPELRRFRRHRRRWDFEPFGLCIRQEWLIERGTRPVLYGDDSLWQSLCEADQPYFQPSHSGQSASDDASERIDWTVECEWRHVGDLDLSQLPREAGLVFVPDFAAARRLSQISPWPITLWPDPKFETTGDTV